MIKKIFKTIGKIILGLFALIFLLLIMSYFIDLVAAPFIKISGDKALREFVSLRKEGYDNAWNYYSQAIEEMGNYRPSDDLEKYIRGKISITEKIEKELKEKQKILDLVLEGTKQPFCSIPLEYEEGWALSLPNYMRLQYISKLLAASALNSLEKGKTEDGLSAMLSGLALAKHTISGAPILLSHMVGIVLMQINLEVLEIAMSNGTFNEQQLMEANLFLDELERDLPMLSWAEECDVGLNKISIASIPFYVPIEHIFLAAYTLEGTISTGGSSGYEEEKEPLFRYDKRAFLFRILCWRYLFSPRLATIRAFNFLEKIFLSDENKEKVFKAKTEKERKSAIFQIEEDEIKKYVNHNPVFGLMLSSYSRMLRRKFEMLAKIRIVNMASVVWQDYIRNGIFPSSLEDLTSDATIDPFTGKTWEYIASKDSVVIMSPGYNQVYDYDDDLTIVLKKTSIKQFWHDEKTREKNRLSKKKHEELEAVGCPEKVIKRLLK